MTHLEHDADRTEPEVVRTEERSTTSTEAVPMRRAVLRVVTTTEEVMIPVTLTRQHAQVEFVDVDPSGALPCTVDHLFGGATSAWMVLTADEPVVTTRPVPVERARLVADWVTREAQISTTLAHDEVTQELLPGR